MGYDEGRMQNGADIGMGSFPDLTSVMSHLLLAKRDGAIVR